MENQFLRQCYKHDTVTENGALSNSTTGSIFVDQFAVASTCMGRKLSEVFSDQAALWENNPKMSIQFIFYLRLITRKIKLSDGFVTDKIQKGQGLKDEALKRLLWLALNHQDVFGDNIWLLPIVGSWKDIWMLMFYDKQYEVNALNRIALFNLIKSGLACETHCDLIKKYMPRIKSNSKLTTDWNIQANQMAKEFAKFMGWSVKDYNKFKTTGTAHEFQKIICAQMYENINWNAIPGRALSNLVHSKFLTNHGLEANYMAWLETQPEVKFNGYVYELAKKVRGKDLFSRWYGSVLNKPKLSVVEQFTINKQFESLINKAKADGKINTKMWCALDTSGSMSFNLNSSEVTPFDVATSLGVFFSTLNEGAFHKHVIMFDSISKTLELHGDFCDMMSQIPVDAMGSTNFNSVVNEIVKIRTNNPNIPLDDYPTALLVVSDMQFNPGFQSSQTNYEECKDKLKTVFPEDWVDSFKFIWWNVTDRLKNFPSTITDGGTYMLGGFDGSVISLLLGDELKEKTVKKNQSMEDLVFEALNQEVLLQVKA